jgi:hypothetical protein
MLLLGDDLIFESHFIRFVNPVLLYRLDINLPQAQASNAPRLIPGRDGDAVSMAGLA